MTDLRLALIFLTRLPLRSTDGPKDSRQDGALARATRYFPVAGAVVGLAGATVYVIAHWLFAPTVAALLAVAATAALTGGLHEDGLADTADGFGGGHDKDTKLAIMRDSRIGTYGVLAILVSILLRTAVLAGLTTSGRVGGALIAVHTLSRATLPFALNLLSPARPDGLGAMAGTPSSTDLGIAATFAICIAAVVLPPAAALAAIVGAAIGTAAVARLATQQIGGQTGDVLGAMQQAAEVLSLLFAAAAMPHGS